MYDLLIKAGVVFDGTGKEGVVADIAIRDHKIAAVGRIDPEQARQVFNAAGKVVAPGFIDCHSGGETMVYRDPSMWNKLEQGITTEIGGNCGLSLAPISSWMYALVILTASETFAHPATARACRQFHKYENYRKAMDGLALGTNMATYVGHHLVRASVMATANRRATGGELKRMRQYVHEAMECGALGLSTGLIYPPGAYADTEEIRQLCLEVARYNGRIASHVRSESDMVLGAVEELIELGKITGIPSVISHHKICGKRNWGKSDQTLALVERTNQAGFKTYLNMYPYTAGATNLRSVIPPQFHARGKKNLLKMLQSPKGRAEIRSAILEPRVDWENFHATAGFEGMLITNAPHQPQVCGKTVSQLASERGVDPFEALFDILVADQLETNSAFFMMDWEEMKRIFASPYCSIGTDGGVVYPGSGSHPRAVGTFPRVLGRLVREEKVISLAQAIYKMTALAAESAGLTGKGQIAIGYDADLVIFDPETVVDSADYLNFQSPNSGIESVFIGGQIVVEHGKHNGALNGKFIWRN